MPAIQAARGFAPTAWKRRPAGVERSSSASRIVNTIPAQNTQLTPSSGFSNTQLDSDGGTSASLAVPSR